MSTKPKTLKLPVLLLLAGSMATAGVFHAVFGVTQAIAATTSATEHPVAEDSTCVGEQTPTELVAALQTRDAELDSKAAELAELSDQLTAAKRDIADQLAELRKAETALAETLAIADGAAEEDLTQLTAVYEAMKPSQAAPVFAEMEPQFAAGFLGRMSPTAAAGILTGLAPEKAYAISVLLAGRNANAPRE